MRKVEKNGRGDRFYGIFLLFYSCKIGEAREDMGEEGNHPPSTGTVRTSHISAIIQAIHFYKKQSLKTLFFVILEAS